MTFILALVWGRGVLLTSDSRSSYGFLAERERKLYPIVFFVKGKEYDLAILAGSGDTALLKQSYEKIEEIFRTWFEKKLRNPSEKELEKLVETIENYLIKRFSELRSLGIQPQVTLILASVTQEGIPKLYEFDSRGIAQPLHLNPGYALIGSGTLTGGLLLLKLLNYSPQFEGDRGLFSSFLIDVVSEVDTSVSPFLGDSIYIRWEEKEKRVVAGALSADEIKKFKWKSRWRKKLIETIWLVAEKLGEKKLTKVLKNLAKKTKDKALNEKIREMEEIMED